METPNVNVGALAVDLIENEGGGVSAHKPHTRVDVTGGQFTGRGRIHVTDNGRNVNTDVQAGEIMLDIAGKYVQQSRGTSCDDHHGQNGFTDSTDAEEGADEGFDLAVTKATFCPPSSQCPAGLRESNGETFDWSAGGDTNGCTQIGVPTGQRLGKYQPGGCPSKECVSCSKPESPDFNCHQTRVFPKHRLGECEEGKLANGGFHISNVSLDRRGEDAAVCCPKNSADSRTATDPIQNVAQIHDSPIQDPCTDTPSPVSSAKSHPDLNDDSLNSEPYTVAEEDENKDIFETTVPIRPKTLRTNPNLTVSLSCDATPLTPEEDGGFYFGDECYEEDFRNTLEAGRRQSAPDELPDLTGEAHSDSKLMPKRFGIAEFFTRSLFSRKSREPKPSHNASAWRLFNKPTSRESEAVKEPASPSSSTEQVDQQQDSSPSLSPQHPPATGRRKNLEFEPLSTTALILEDRPSNLPAKSLEETQRHKQEYEEMVAGAKKRELKEAQKKKRQMKERHKQEDIISNAMVIWNTEILPNWDSMKGTRRVRELWWQGLPPSVRGRVWSLAIGNELNITPELYEIFLSRAKEKWRSYSETSSVNDSESDGGASLADRESSLDLIKLDISRTFPSLFIFQKGGPYHDLLHSVLGAYTCYRPDIGYVQGMSFIAAVLILNLEEADAFITFANLLNKPCQMAFFRVDHELMLKYFSVFEVFFEENLPRLFSHFQTNSLTPDLYLIDWIFTLYSKSLPLDVACRVWDVFCRDGEESLFRTGLGILRLFEDVLLQMDFIHIAQFLTRLPEDLQSHTLFAAMANTHMVSRNRRWAQVFSTLMKDGNKEMEKSGSPALRS